MYERFKNPSKQLRNKAVASPTGREAVAEHIRSLQQCFQPFYLHDIALQWLLCAVVLVTFQLWEENRFEAAPNYSRHICIRVKESKRTAKERPMWV
jgi:hypothetical protein